jgi:hypothetical protein
MTTGLIFVPKKGPSQKLPQKGRCGERALCEQKTDPQLK